MNRYSHLAIGLWIVSILASAAVAFHLRSAVSVCLRALRLSLWIQLAVQIGGFLCVAFGSPWAYYREYLVAGIASVLADAVLLAGIWRSFYPRPRRTPVRIAALALAALMGALSAEGFSSGLPSLELRRMTLLAYSSGYVFCALIFLMAMLAWMRGAAWRPAAARCMIGYAITTAATFGIQQTEAVLGWNRWYLYYAPQVFYLLALGIWNSAVPFDRPKPFTPEEMTRLEAALAESMGRVLPPQRSTQA